MRPTSKEKNQMANLNGFDAETVDPNIEFEPLPAGKYAAIIDASEMKPTKSGNGSYLELTFQVVDGECKGRKVWSRLNLTNPNNQAVKIAQAELSAICRAVGVMRPQDSTELHNKPLMISVKCKTRADNGEITNEIKGYYPINSAQGVPQQAATSAPPWAKV